MKKILIIRFSSIGDIVLTTPVVRCLKQQSPATEVHYLTKKGFRNLLESNPYLSKIHVMDKHVNEVMEELKKEKFDHIIDLHNNLRTATVKLKLRRSSVSFRKMNFKKWLIVRFKLRKMVLPHIVDRYMETVKQFGIENDHKGLDYFIPPSDEISTSTLPLNHQNGFIAFVIGAKHYTKQLPTEKIISICKKLSQPIVLLGGKEDMDRAKEIEAAVGSTIFNACGKYNLNQSASFIRQAKKVISHDTGLMHVAAAFKKEIISVWGNTVPAFGFTPYLPGTASKIVEVKDLPCRPCSKIGYPKCPQGHFKCMRNIDEGEFLRE
ncbi:MAG: glycosyl transferase [Bacteroidota bacterium]|nr:glycosyl transferase [Bacteroidota bacterium]